MNYLTTSQTADKWHITKDRVLKLAKAKRIPGVIQIGSRWLIPDNATKPSDARYRNVKDKDDNYTFRYPDFACKDINSFNPPLSETELKIKELDESFNACEFDKTQSLLDELLNKPLNIIHLIYVYCIACKTYALTSRVNDYRDCYRKLSDVLKKDFPRKKEMSSLIHEVDNFLGNQTYFLDEFKVDYSYKYHESYMSHLYVLCLITYTNVSDFEKVTVKDLMAYEGMCSSIDNSDNYQDKQLMHLNLFFEYAKIQNKKDADYHLRKAIELSYDHKLYCQLAVAYYYNSTIINPVLSEFPEEFVSKIKYLSEKIHNNYMKFVKQSSMNTFYSKLPNKYFVYVHYAVQGLTNKEVASHLHVSESNVGNIYSTIYNKLGVNNKAELIEYYKNVSFNKTI